MLTRICLVVENHPWAVMGGAQYQAHLLAEELAHRDKVSVTYLARRAPKGAASSALTYEVRSIGAGAGFRRRTVLIDAPDLYRTLRSLSPHVIYQRMRQSYTGVCAAYARRHGASLIFHVASEFDLDPRLWPARLSANLPFDLAEAVIGKWGIKHAAHVIVQSERQARMLAQGFARTPARIVRNFQPLPDALPQKPSGALKVVWVANLKRVKRPELFLQLAESFSDRRDIEFIMVGRPPPPGRFQPLMDKIGRQKNLQYLAEQPLAAVNALLSQAQVLVSTSLFEGFPNTFIQAWSRGAVVASLGVDIDGGLDAQGVGFCVQNIEQLRSVVERLAESPADRNRMAEKAFRHVQAHHSLGNAVDLADFLLAARDSAATVSRAEQLRAQYPRRSRESNP